MTVFKSIKMKAGEMMSEFDKRFSSIVIKMASLVKECNNMEISLKRMRALPQYWDVMTLHDHFADLKAYEVKLRMRIEASISQTTKSLVDSNEIPNRSAELMSMMPCHFS
ncbi:hypothetical protein F511_17557 [Dorcoceras hygrometricum]|uniref:Uncharacterized protein n=1 Tax=Dorcoceras hygrometricum TaxID=472368 RepID=A0A2Z7B6X5_9LAMI|nr:hypothetical protein F511_17557 [Dorcoceras hygrometricum]